MKIKLPFLVAIIFITLIASTLLADGKVFPPKAIKVSPAIPYQRALIAHKDGVEKLTIETTFKGSGEQFGWVIPLPNVPTEYQQVSSGLIKTLDLNLQPKIIHKGIMGPSASLALLVTIVFLFYVISRGRSSISKFVLAIVIVVLCLFTLMPSLGAVKGAEGQSGLVDQVTVAAQHDVGDYLVTVLRAEISESLEQWLESNGFYGLSKNDKTIVDDYIRQKWCFVTAKLKRDGDDLSSPHPIMLTFPSKQPIYPMRLTGTVGSDVYLELFIVGNQVVSNGFLRKELSDKFHFRENAQSRYTDSYESGKFGIVIGHPQVSDIMWDGCWITKLVGTLTPEQMQEDILLEWEDGKPYRKNYYSNSGRNETMCAIGLTVWWISLIVFTLYVKLRKKVEVKFNRWLVFVLLCSFIMSLVWMSATYVLIRPIPVNEVLGSRWDVIFQDQSLRGYSRALQDEFPLVYYNSTEQLKDDLRKFLRLASLNNAYSHEALTIEDSPGNITIEEIDDQVVYLLYTKGAATFPSFEMQKTLDDTCLEYNAQTLGSLVGCQDFISDVSGVFQGSTVSYVKARLLVELYKKQPLELLPTILEYLDKLRQKENNQEESQGRVQREIANTLRTIACITHIVYPVQVDDRDSVDTYIKQVSEFRQ